MMTLDTLAVIIGALVPIVGAILAIGKAAQMLRDHERRITRLENDDDAEDAARIKAGHP
ncbi:MAG: hypothetical protein ACK56C_05155 [Alphaproteobacteria bacterium]|jgi:hypothetical protein